MIWKCKPVSGVVSTVDDVEARDREHGGVRVPCHIGEVLEERLLLGTYETGELLSEFDQRSRKCGVNMSDK